jgi:hypothetical protein
MLQNDAIDYVFIAVNHPLQLPFTYPLYET